MFRETLLLISISRTGCAEPPLKYTDGKGEKIHSLDVCSDENKDIIHQLLASLGKSYNIVCQLSYLYHLKLFELFNMYGAIYQGKKFKYDHREC